MIQKKGPEDDYEQKYSIQNYENMNAPPQQNNNNNNYMENQDNYNNTNENEDDKNYERKVRAKSVKIKEVSKREKNICC